MVLYDISASLVYFIFYFWHRVTWRHVFVHRSWWNLYCICKIEFQAHFVRENFSIFDLFFEIIMIIVYIYIYIKYDRGFTDRDEICIAYVKSNSKHIFFENVLIYYIFFEIITIIMWYIQLYIYIYILAPIWGGSGTRSPLIFWDTFPRYLRILFHPKKENDNYDQNW